MKFPFFKFESAGKYLLSAVLVIVPLFPKFPLVHIPGTYVAIRIEDLLLLALGIVVFLKVFADWKNIIKDKITLSFIIFFAAGLVSLLAGVFITRTAGFNLGLLHWLRRIEYVIPFFAAYLLLDGKKVSQNLNFYLNILMIDVFIIFIYGIGQRYFNFPIIITQNEEYSKGVALRFTAGGHINSTFAGHYDLASFMVIALPIFLSTLFILKDRVSKLMLLLTSGMSLWLLIASVSRIGQLAYFSGVAVAFTLIKKLRALAVILIISVLLAAMSGSLGARFKRVFDVFYLQVKNGFAVGAQEISIPARRLDNPTAAPTPVPVFEDRSTSIRLNVEWPRAIRAFSKNPLVGTGYSSINLATDNDYLRMLGEIGLMGFLSFLLIFLRIGELFIREGLPLKSRFQGPELGFLAGVAGGLVASFVTATFIDIFEASKFAITFWLIIGLAVYLLKNRQYVQKN